jgi:hypothetical protein
VSKGFINKYLVPYWISFPDNQYYPFGFGVTAFSVEDAYSIFEEFGFDYHKTAKEIKIIENIKYDEIPYSHKTELNMGPMVVRGIWFPHLNSGP